MTLLVYIAFLAAPTIFSMLPKHLLNVGLFATFFNIADYVSCAIVFLMMTDKSSLRSALAQFPGSSYWPSKNWVFMLSVYIPLYGLYGSDGVVHCKLDA